MSHDDIKLYLIDISMTLLSTGKKLPGGYVLLTLGQEVAW